MNILGCVWITFLVACLPLVAQADTDLREKVWGHLVRHIGTYDYDAVLNDEGVSTRLTEILGDRVPQLRERLRVHGRIGFNGSCLTLTGNKPHRGGEDNAYLNVCTCGGITVVLLTRGNLEIFSPVMKYEDLDWQLRAWVVKILAGPSDPFSDVPPGTTFMTIENTLP